MHFADDEAASVLQFLSASSSGVRCDDQGKPTAPKRVAVSLYVSCTRQRFHGYYQDKTKVLWRRQRHGHGDDKDKAKDP